jgi:hypothetical protein
MQWICGLLFLIVLCSTISSSPYAVPSALLEFWGGVFASIISLSGAFVFCNFTLSDLVSRRRTAGEAFLLVYAVIHIQRKIRNWR